MPDRRLIIVGCATGIGAAGARRLAADGWRLGLIDIAEEPLSEVAEDVGAVAAIVADAADPGALTAAVDEAITALGGLDAAWSNVGVQTTGGVEDATVEDLDRCYSLNVRAHFVLAQRAVPTLREAGGGALLVTASNAGVQTEDRLVTYAATKASAVALARLLARDQAGDGIRVNALCPGFVDTPFNAPVWSNFGGRERFLAEIGKSIPLGRMATPEEIADLVAFIFGPAATYITGQAIIADGGETVA